jgi:hypothetical protein
MQKEELHRVDPGQGLGSAKARQPPNVTAVMVGTMRLFGPDGEFFSLYFSEKRPVDGQKIVRPGVEG